MYIDLPPLVSTEASRQALLCRWVMTKLSLRLFIILLVEIGVTEALNTQTYVASDLNAEHQFRNGAVSKTSIASRIN
jgi:hypothetical protein